MRSHFILGRRKVKIFLAFFAKASKMGVGKMELDSKVFEKVAAAGSQILVVSKYFDAAQTAKILESASKFGAFLALGENRIANIISKNLPPKHVHFIGKIQSRDIPKIASNCQCAHSVENLAHAQKLLETNPLFKFFVQIKIDPQKSSGIEKSEISQNFARIFGQNSARKYFGRFGNGAGRVFASGKRSRISVFAVGARRIFPRKNYFGRHQSRLRARARAADRSCSSRPKVLFAPALKNFGNHLFRFRAQIKPPQHQN